MRKLTHEEIPRVDPAEISSLPRHPLRVIAHNIRSVHNVGSILRTSDAAAIERLYVTGYSASPDHPSIHRSALGAQHLVPWERSPDARGLLLGLQREGFFAAALEITDEPTPMATLTADHFPLCLIVGNEVEGVPEDLLDLCDVALEIPQYGAKQSLNVSVAYGIAVMGLVERYRSLRASP